MLDNDHRSLATPLFKRRITRQEMLLTTGGALPTEEGEEGRDMRAYPCDGFGLNEWFAQGLGAVTFVAAHLR